MKDLGPLLQKVTEIEIPDIITVKTDNKLVEAAIATAVVGAAGYGIYKIFSKKHSTGPVMPEGLSKYDQKIFSDEARLVSASGEVYNWDAFNLKWQKKAAGSQF